MRQGCINQVLVAILILGVLVGLFLAWLGTA
jgi:hypothetical protein